MRLPRSTFARLVAPLVVATLFLLSAVPSGQAQVEVVPEWVDDLVLADSNLVTLSSPASTEEELPGLGHKFELLFAMMDDQDPQNLTNDVISVLTNPAYPAGIGVAFRNTPPDSRSLRWTIRSI